MSKIVIAFASIFAGIVLCIALANTSIGHDIPNHYSIFNICLFITTLVFGLYAINEYGNHKREMQTNLLCQYNQRYSADQNIKKVIEWMLKTAHLDKKGEIDKVNLLKSLCSPSINTKEMFMRFFEELQLQIEEKNLNAKDVYELFSYYAIKFDEFNEYHKDITDYTPIKEVYKMAEDQRKSVNENWRRFSKFIEEMHEIKRNQK